MPTKDTQFKKGHIPANKKNAVIIVCKQCKKDFGVQPYRKNTTLFCSRSCKAKFNSAKEKHWNWKGGIAETTNYGTKDRISVMEILGFECCKCGYTDLRALQIDHINGNGHEERRTRGTESYYRFILNKVLSGSKYYQILCANCNWIKRSENKEGTNRIKLQ